MLQAPTMTEHQQQRRALAARLETLLGDETEELQGRAAIAVAKLGADEISFYQDMSDALLRRALKQLARQSAGGFCLAVGPLEADP